MRPMRLAGVALAGAAVLALAWVGARDVPRAAALASARGDAAADASAWPGPDPSDSVPPRAPRKPGTPELPRAYVDTRYVAPAGRVLTVRAGGDLQRALDRARPGDVVALEAGARWVGNFVLPRKEGAGWVVVRSAASDAALPREGTRVAPRDAPRLPALATPNDRPALATARGAHHYRLLGLEITALPSVGRAYALLALGDGGEGQNTPALIPHHLIVDRAYVHGHARLELRRCIALNSAWSAVIDSYVAECHDSGFDSQAVAGWNGPGPFRVANNYLEGAGENLLFGGADAAVRGLVPADIEVRRNHVYKPASWRERWLVKNSFEIKNAERVLVEGNVFEGSWRDGQNGEAWVIKASGDAPWTACRDITLRYNHVLRVDAGVNIAKQAVLAPERVLIQHNVFDPVPGRAWQLVGAMRDIVFDHNTAGGGTHLLLADEDQQLGVVLTNNVGVGGEYGIFTSSGMGSGAFRHQMPNAVMTGNVIIGVEPSRYPGGNYYPPTVADVGFVNYPSDPRLSAGSRFKGRAPDGSDPGADVGALRRLTRGVTAR